MLEQVNVSWEEIIKTKWTKIIKTSKTLLWVNERNKRITQVNFRLTRFS